jgi:hypothetical protein
MLFYRDFLRVVLFCLPTFVAESAVAQTLDLVSQRPDLETTLLSELPANSGDTAQAGSCPSVLPNPTTAAGKSVAAMNWQVTAEIESGALTFVSFVGKVEAGTSGSCLLTDGNIGIFHDTKPLGLIYGAKNTPRSIGSLQPLEGGNLRIWDGDYLSAPLADLQILDDTLVILRNVADRDTFCAGTASAPNIYGLPIHLARRLLLAEGWQPATALDSELGTYAEDAQQSLPELQECSGTGFGYCLWNYVKLPDQQLSVVTAGEGGENTSPSVASFQVSCEAQ